MIGYAQMLAALYGARRLGVRFELDRVRAALVRLGSPERRVGPVVHVGGTNGKGSTGAFVEAALRAAGRRTGLFTSPHLSRFTERIRVDGVEADPGSLAARYVRLASTLGEAAAELTFFELATLLGLVTFAEEGTEVVVLEVGLGGRLDATNAVGGDVAVVTGVALDHTDVLGPDLLAIAREKAGIFRPGRPAIVGASGEPEGVALLENGARVAGAAPIVVLGRDAPDAPPAGWPLGLPGAHQARNAAAALAALDALERATAGRVVVPEAARRRGLAAARWAGRLETIAVPGGAPVLLDAAHNPQGAHALAAAIPAGAHPVVVVVGVSADKDVAGIVAPLAARGRAVIATETPSVRALPAAALAAVASAIVPAGVTVEAAPDPLDALARARARAGAGGLVVAYGSLFLVGALRARLLGEPVDPIVVQDPAAGR